MGLGTLATIAAEDSARIIEDGGMTLAPQHYMKFRKQARMTPVANIDLGDVIEIRTYTAGPYKGGALVGTVLSKGEDDGMITFNGIPQSAGEIRAIAACNFEAE